MSPGVGGVTKCRVEGISLRGLHAAWLLNSSWRRLLGAAHFIALEDLTGRVPQLLSSPQNQASYGELDPGEPRPSSAQVEEPLERCRQPHRWAPPDAILAPAMAGPFRAAFWSGGHPRSPAVHRRSAD